MGNWLRNLLSNLGALEDQLDLVFLWNQVDPVEKMEEAIRETLFMGKRKQKTKKNNNNNNGINERPSR